jgi:hypothetical protein
MFLLRPVRSCVRPCCRLWLRGGARLAAPAARALVIVPQLIGRRQEEAHRPAARSGLTVRWAGFTGRLANGHHVVRCVKVLRQSPAADERRPRGAAISVIEVACTVPQGWAHVAH